MNPPGKYFIRTRYNCSPTYWYVSAFPSSGDFI
jgi:hypothetical protein